MFLTKPNRTNPDLNNEWYRVEGTHEAIIDRELWDKVQSLIERKKQNLFPVGIDWVICSKKNSLYVLWLYNVF